MENESPSIKSNKTNKLYAGLTLQSWLWIGLFVFVIFTRFHHLGDKPFHHDESLYGKYIWNFHVGQGYKYDPMQHGPFLFHISQVILFLFGVTNYTIRIVPALTGVFITLAFFLMRRRLPSGVALMTGWLFAINSVAMYFQRFLLHDQLFALFAMLMILVALLWFADRKQWQFYLFCASTSILYCIKGNAFVHYLTIYLFVILFAVYWLFMQKKKLSELFQTYPLATKTFGAVTFWGILFVVYAAVNQFWKSGFGNWEKAVHSYWIIVYVIFFLLIGIFVYLGEAVRINPDKRPLGLASSFYKDSHVFAFGTVIFFGILILLYTTLGQNPKGFWGAMYEWYTYWLHQHSIARISGPFHYFHHQMAIYAFLSLSVLLVAVLGRGIRRNPVIFTIYIVGSILLIFGFRSLNSPLPLTKENLFSNEHLALAIVVLVGGLLMTFSYFRQREYLKSFYIWWFTIAYIIYSYLQEKVPWLVMHIVTPMILYAALVMADVIRDRKSFQKWARYTIFTIFGFLIAYELHTSFQLCWHNEADPVEQMVYVQTTYEVPKIMEEIERIAHWENTLHKKELPIVINGHATWPFYWYLRDWKGISYGSTVNPSTHLMVICNWEDRHKFAEKMDDKYVARQYGLRAWFLPKYADVAKDGKFWRNAWRWLVYREKFNPTLYGAQQICVFTRKDVAMFQKGIDLGPAPTKPQRREAPRRDSINISSIKTFGLFGSQRGNLNSPKGVAMDSIGNIYVADQRNNRIQKFDQNGKFLLAWGSSGSENGQFNQPSGIFVGNQDNVFVTDTWNHRIQKFDSEGKFIMAFGDSSTFWAPKGVVEDPDGFLYVANTGFHNIMKYTRGGSKLWSVGVKGDGPKEFTEPVGICLDKKGQVYVADTANKRISVFDGNGNHLRQISVFGLEEYYTEPYIAIDETNQRVFLTDSRNNHIQIFDLNGEFIGFWGSEGADDGQFKLPTGIAFRDGKLVVTEAQNHRIQVFDAAMLN